MGSGPYSRSDGLSAAMRAAGWKHVEMIYNDGEVGGGWKHDLLNDSVFASMLAKARAGGYDAIHAGFPCSTGALSLGVPGGTRGAQGTPSGAQRRNARSGHFFHRKMISRGVTRLIEHTRNGMEIMLLVHNYWKALWQTLWMD